MINFERKVISMKKLILVLLITLLLQTTESSAQTPLYENTVKTDYFANTWDATGQVYILLDDVNVPVSSLGTADSLVITKVVFGLYRTANAPGVKVNYYYSTVNDGSTSNADICSIPAKDLGSVDYRINGSNPVVIKETFGDGVNPLFTMKINNGALISGYHTFFLGLSTSKRTGDDGTGSGWDLTDGSEGAYFDSAWASNRNGNTIGFAASNNGSGTNDQVYYAEVYGYPKGVLPVSIINFSATAKNNTVLLNWSTANEVNNDYFTIERSSNNKDFAGIGKVNSQQATSNNVQQYSFTDNSPLKGVSYYRLKQTDKDGKFSYSKVVTADVALINQMMIKPTIVKDGSFTIDFGSVRNNITISITDNNGREIYHQTISSSQLIHINAPVIGGVYYVHAVYDGGEETKKIIVE